jgi:hypothetical protein
VPVESHHEGHPRDSGILEGDAPIYPGLVAGIVIGVAPPVPFAVLLAPEFSAFALLEVCARALDPGLVAVGAADVQEMNLTGLDLSCGFDGVLNDE